MPRAAASSARSAASTAGWVISVRISSASASSRAAGSVPVDEDVLASAASPEQRASSPGRPRRSVSATIGSEARRVASMFTYCDPWPVYRNATLAGGPLPAEDPPARERPPLDRVPRSEGLERQPAFSARSAPSRVVDRDPLRRAQVGLERAAPAAGTRPAPTCRLDRAQPRHQLGLVEPPRRPARPAGGALRFDAAPAARTLGPACRPADRERRSPGRRSTTARARTPPARRGSWCRRSRTRSRRPARMPPAGTSHSRSSVLTENGEWAQSMFGLGRVEVEARRQHLVVQREHRLEQPGGAGRRLQVADVRLDRAQRDRAGGAGPAPPKTSPRLSTSTTSPTRGRRAVALDRAQHVAGDSPARSQARCDGQPLAHRVRAR